MLQPESVTIQDGYQLCGVCGELLLNGDSALVMARTYAHPTCVTDTRVPQEWKVARRVDAYNQTNPDTTTEEYWENQLLEFKNYQREAQPCKARESSGDGEDNEFVPHTGQRWNGNVLADCREVASSMAGWCDVSKVSRLMVEITDRQIMAEERANLHVTWTRPQLEQDAAENFGRPLFSNADERTSIGKDGGLDAVPQDEVFTDEDGVKADDGYEEAGFN